MSEICNTFPTLTSAVEFTTLSLSIATSFALTTAPPTVITSTSTIPCTATLGGTCTPNTITSLVTIPGGVQSVQIPVTVSVPVTFTGYTTLYGSSCTVIPITGPAPSIPTTSIYTPPPSIITTESSSTKADGSVVVSTIIVSQTRPGIPVIISSTPPPKASSPVTIAPIVGGAVGGFFGLIAIVIFIWFLLKRRRRWDDIFDGGDDDDAIAPAPMPPRNNTNFSLDATGEPKPYEYGLVGKGMAPYHSPPSSPPFGPTGPTHSRNPSFAPLLPSTNYHSPQPSTVGSMPVFHPAELLQPMPIGPTVHGYTNANVGFTSPPMSVSNYSTTAIGSDDSRPTRSGSPTSILEPRILHVANQMSPTSDIVRFSDSFSSSSAAAAGASQSQVLPQRDGKGRLLRPADVKAPLVHLDGGRVQQQQEQQLVATTSAAPVPLPVSEAGPAPPAYEA